MRKIKISETKVAIGIIISMLLILAIISLDHCKNNKQSQNAIDLPPYPFKAENIIFMPYDKDKERASLGEKINAIAKSSGAGIIIITTYEQSKKELIHNFQEKVYALIRKGNIKQVEIEGHNRYILKGDRVNDLFKE
ncbi:MAG: hypothetical protein AB9856_14195 [Cellulosilyticaceae bacterium]